MDEDDHTSDDEEQEIFRKKMEFGVTRVALARALRLVVVIEDCGQVSRFRSYIIRSKVV